MKQVYRSKIDIWLLILILAAWGIPLTFIVWNEFSAGHCPKFCVNGNRIQL